MNEPIIFTVGDIVAIIKAITWLIGSIGVVGGAVMWLWHKLRKPNADQNARLDALEAWQKSIEERIQTNENHFEELDKSDKVTKKAILALLSHGIDGNSIEPMREAKSELESYLIEK